MTRLARRLYRLGGMVWTWRQLTLVGVAGLYLTGAGLLAGVTIERVRADRERVAVVKAQAQRQREARERVMRVEREHEAARAAPR